MESNGARLKKLRLEKGISLEEVHKKTKIHLNILKAIEEDNLIGLSPIYIKGFLKIYCRFLDVDPKDFLPNYTPQKSITRYVAETKEKPLSFFKSVSIKLVSFRPYIKLRIVFIIILLLIFSIGLFNLGKIISAKRSSLATEAKSEKTKSVTVTAKTQHSEITAPEKNRLGIKLIIRAKEDCWIQLKVDGRIIFQNMLKKGRFETWQAKDKIEFSLGNAGAVDLEVNGKLISNLGRRGRALKNILITKEGLSISR